MQAFPNPAALNRLAAAALAELHDEWQAFDRRYLSEGSMAALFTANPTEDDPQLPPARTEPARPVTTPLQGHDPNHWSQQKEKTQLTRVWWRRMARSQRTWKWAQSSSSLICL